MQIHRPPNDPRVARALEQALEMGEIGVAVAAYSGNELVIDQWIGHTDEGRRNQVTEHTLFPVLSVTKAMTATALHLQVERGLVEYDAPVAAYWPDFARAGKEEVTVRHVLCHQSGLASMPPEATPSDLLSWQWVTSRLAEMGPVHRPGENNAYHALSFGWILGEVIRRTDSAARLPCRFIQEELLAALEIDDVYLSLPEREDGRVATLTTGGAPQRDFSKAALREKAAPAPIAPRADVYNLTETRRACNPSAGAIASARGIARFFALLANGGVLQSRRLLSERRVHSFLQPRPHNTRDDLVAGGPTSVGAGGYWVRDPALDIEPLVESTPNVLYQTGAGGTIAIADLDQRFALAICHNRMFGPPPIDRHPWIRLVQTAREVALT